MRIKVTEENIDQYDLVRLTGQPREVLREMALNEMAQGNEFYVRIPDVVGGDTEAPTDRNVFEHFTEMPVPDGHMHEQKTTSLIEECSYKLGLDEIFGVAVFVCIVHGATSVYPVDAESHAPCKAIEGEDNVQRG